MRLKALPKGAQMPAIRLQIAASGFESGAVVEADKATADNLIMNNFATRADKDEIPVGTLETASANLSVEQANELRETLDGVRTGACAGVV